LVIATGESGAVRCLHARVGPLHGDRSAGSDLRFEWAAADRHGDLVDCGADPRQAGALGGEVSTEGTELVGEDAREGVVAGGLHPPGDDRPLPENDTRSEQVAVL
jgi:hypothetical protein